MQEAEKNNILDRIERDNQKAEQIKKEKAQLLEIRKKMRIEADMMKTEMTEYFEKIDINRTSLDEAHQMMSNFSTKFEEKYKSLMAEANTGNYNSPTQSSGKFKTIASEKKLKKSGTHTQSKQKLNNYTPMSEAEIKAKLDKLVKQQSEELMQVILEEEAEEENRNKELEEISDPKERNKKDQEFGLLRGIASDKIKKLAKKHDRNLIDLEKKLRGIK